MDHFEKNEKEVYGVVFGYDDKGLKVLLVKEEHIIGSGCWKLPSRFSLRNESANKTFGEILNDLNVHSTKFVSHFKPCMNFDKTCKIVYFVMVDLNFYRMNFAIAKSAVRFVEISKIPSLKADHNMIFDYSIYKLNKYLVRTNNLKNSLERLRNENYFSAQQ